MADLTISSAATLTAATLATGDLIPVLDVSADAGSKGSNITAAELSKFVAISNPGVAYVRTDGDNDTAEIGNPAKPYETAQAAWVALKALHNNTNDAHVFNIGFGEFDLDLTLTEIAAGYELFVTGEGGSVSSILNITNSEAAADGLPGAPGSGGSDGVDYPVDYPDFGGNAEPGGTGNPGGSGSPLAMALTISSNQSVLVNLSVSGGSGGEGGQGGQGGQGGDGYVIGGTAGVGGDGGVGGSGGNITGTLTLAGVVANLAELSPGLGGSGGPGGGGNQGGGPQYNNSSDGNAGVAGQDGDFLATADVRLCILANVPFAINPPGNFYDGVFVSA
jgi:hypothetical protein